MRPGIPTIVLALLFAWPAAATEDKGGEEEEHGEEEAAGEEEHGGHGEGHHRFSFGFLGSGIWLRNASEEIGLAGGGGFAELSVVHQWLEIELGARVMLDAEHNVHVPIDLLFKKPFSVPHATIFLGIGPSVNIVAHHEETHVYMGVAGSVGMYLWVAGPFGLTFQLLESVVFEEEVTNEFGGAAGIVFGI